MSPSRRFSATAERTQQDLQRTLRRMGATGLRVEQDFDTGACEIRFDRTGRRYVFRNGSYAHPWDNMRATEQTISLLYRALEMYGTTSTDEALSQGASTDPFEQFFLGFAALPDDSVLMLGSGLADWWEVLGVSREAPLAEIRNAYRALARVHHPDVGGSPGEFQRIQKAYEQGVRERGG